MCKRIDGEIIRGVINDPRLFSGIERVRSGRVQMFGKRIVQVESASRNATLKSRHQKGVGTQRKLMGFGIGLRVVIIAMAHLLNGPMFAVTSMMSALIAV
jgi:hypothetical protein